MEADAMIPPRILVASRQLERRMHDVARPVGVAECVLTAAHRHVRTRLPETITVHAKLGGPKGLAYAPGELFVADTESHAVRRIDLTTGIITTVLGTGVKGDGPEPSPLQCKLSRPHGVLADASSALFVSDREAQGSGRNICMLTTDSSCLTILFLAASLVPISGR